MALASNLVVKLGGEVIDSPRLPALAAAVAELVRAGHRVTVVHGAGPQTTELSRRLGLTPQIVAGRRVTDGPTLDVLEMVLGRLSVALCAALRAAGARPVGLHTVARARRRGPQHLSGSEEPVDLGLVGDVTGIDRPLLDWLAADGRVAVLACLGSSDEGQVYNINADVVAGQIATTLAADALVLVTNTDGVRRDAADPGSRIPTLTVAQGRSAIANGSVTGGMIPKLEEAFATLAAGVHSILIIAAESDLARAIAAPGSVGTRIDP